MGKFNRGSNKIDGIGKEEKNKNSKESKNKKTKEDKNKKIYKKRTYKMENENLKRLKMIELKEIEKEKDLYEIVNEAIEYYFENEYS